MKVSLIDYTGIGNLDPSDHAATVLIFTKNTRLEMSPGLMEESRMWPKDKKIDALSYMANTIPSSHEFCHYTFMIEGVTRSFTHQFVRTRTASFAQQTLRILNVKGWKYGTGPTIDSNPILKAAYDAEMNSIALRYDGLIAGGAAIEDARGILPTNILTNIVMSCNLRTLVEMVRKRSSPRTQSEYRDVLEAMKAAAIEVHPWVKMFVDRTKDQAMKDLDNEIDNMATLGEINSEKRIRMMKLVDQIRQKED